jgi:hypothetical protein
LSACSIAFLPLAWEPSGKGIQFDAIDLVEISTVVLPCCAGATCKNTLSASCAPPARARAYQAEGHGMTLAEQVFV